MSKAKEVSDVVRVIPEAYFDILCRVVPGIVFVSAVAHFVCAGIKYSWSDLVVCLVIGFAIAFMLDCAFDFIVRPISVWWAWRKVIGKHAAFSELQELHSICSNQVKEQQQEGCAVANTQERFPPHAVKLNILETLRNYCRSKDRHTGEVVTKLVAEERLMRMIVFGLPLGITAISIMNVDSSTRFGNALGKLVLPFPRLLLLIFLELFAIAGWLNRIERPVARAFFWWRNNLRKSK